MSSPVGRLIVAGADAALYVRRSIHVAATPSRVWRELASFERMNGWWGKVVGEPEAGTSKGMWLRVYEPRVGGRIEMEVPFDGEIARFGGTVRVFEPERELCFDNDWIPPRGAPAPTTLTLRLTPMRDGTLVELLPAGFDSADDHEGYEIGWGMTQLSALREAVAQDLR